MLPARRSEGGQRRWLPDEVEEFLRARTGHGPAPVTAEPAEDATPTPRPVPSKAAANRIRKTIEQPYFPWQEDVDEAESEVKFLNARREAAAVRRAMDEEARELERRTEAERKQHETERRLEKLRADGRSLARNLPAEWQAKVAADLQSFVTAEQFPNSLTAQEEWTFLQARVLGVRDLYWEAERQKQESQREKETEERKREEKERRRAQVTRLITDGEAIARSRTIWWERDDREAARQAIRDELEAEVEWDWTTDQIRGLVADFLDRWDEDEEDERDEIEEDDEASSGNEDEDIDDSDDWDD
jgi:hypothetical protein